MREKKHLYLKLFTSTFYLSSFTFGGGYVIISLIKKKFVDELKWIDEEQMLDFTAIAQSSPGSIAVNAAILLGYYIAGPLGALVAILGTVLPPLITLSIISLFYTAFRDNVVVNAVLKGMQAGVAAVISHVFLSLGGSIVKEKRVIPILVMIAAFIAKFIFDVNVLYIILACAAIGIAQIFFYEKYKKRHDRK